MKDKKFYIGILAFAVILTLVFVIFYKGEDPEPQEFETEYKQFERVNVVKLESYEDYTKNKDKLEETINEEDFKEYKYLLVSYTIDDCGETIDNKYYKVEKGKLNIYYDVKLGCGVCAPLEKTDVFKIKKEDFKEEYNVYYTNINILDCEPMVAYKPMIYVYPTKDMDLTIKLGNKDLLTSTYPKYVNSWNIHVSKDANIYDYETTKNYYGLYWEALDYTKLDMSEGFVVKGEDTVKFLEEKLAYLGLNEYEINEFIVYWISKLENNNYNFFRFRTLKEIEDYMPIYISEKPDTLIRVLVDQKALDEYIEVKPQELKSVERKGYTVVEWGLTPHK